MNRADYPESGTWERYAYFTQACTDFVDAALDVSSATTGSWSPSSLALRISCSRCKKGSTRTAIRGRRRATTIYLWHGLMVAQVHRAD